MKSYITVVLSLGVINALSYLFKSGYKSREEEIPYKIAGAVVCAAYVLAIIFTWNI